MQPNERLYNVVKGLVDKFDDSYMLAEVGTDTATSALWTFKALKGSKKWFHTIDPYGGKPYNINETTTLEFDYTDHKYRGTLATLSRMAKEENINHCHWKIRSHDFIKIFDQLEFWGDGKIMEPKFCWAYLDGDHAWSAIIPEFDYFYDRMPKGGVICIDDYNLLSEGSIPSVLAKYEGSYQLIVEDEHYRIYFTK